MFMSGAMAVARSASEIDSNQAQKLPRPMGSVLADAADHRAAEAGVREQQRHEYQGAVAALGQAQQAGVQDVLRPRAP